MKSKKAKKSAADEFSIQCEILTKNGVAIKSDVDDKLTENGKLSVEFQRRPRSFTGIKIETEMSRKGNVWDPELTLRDIQAKFPPKWKFWLLKK